MVKFECLEYCTKKGVRYYKITVFLIKYRDYLLKKTTLGQDQAKSGPEEIPELKAKQREAEKNLSKLEQKQLLKKFIAELKADEKLADMNKVIEDLVTKECQKNPRLRKEDVEMNLWKAALEPLSLSLIEKLAEARDISGDFEGYDPVDYFIDDNGRVIDVYTNSWLREFKTYVEHYRMGKEEELDRFADVDLNDNQFKQMPGVLYPYCREMCAIITRM